MEIKEEILNKEIAEKLMEIKGEARGATFKNDAFLISEKEGEESLRKVEEELEKVGCPIKYKEIKTFGFYPIGLKAISLLAIKKALGWGDEVLRDARSFGMVLPTIVRIYMKYFYSLDTLFKQAPRMWHEFFTVGKLTIPDYNKEEKYLILELRDFDLHPIFCLCLEGEIEFFVQMAVKAKEVECRETKCTFRGDEYHRFKITWK